MFLFQSLAHLNAMARLKQEEVLKQRISEATGTPIGDINAQDSRWLYISTACKKVLNSGLGPFKDQTAEMVLFWSFFYTKVLFFPIMIIMLCNPVPGTKEAAC